jgi:hypothetical protein
MKILFLDVDGVLNSNLWNDSHEVEISKGQLIDENAVELLAKIIKETEAKLVMHSGWRFWMDNHLKPINPQAEYLIRLFDKYELEIFDITPDFSTDKVRQKKKFSLVKAKEILAWLEQHDNIDKYIVLEDLDLHNNIIGQQQIQTNNLVGLTKEDVSNAIQRLNA